MLLKVPSSLKEANLQEANLKVCFFGCIVIKEIISKCD